MIMKKEGGKRKKERDVKKDKIQGRQLRPIRRIDVLIQVEFSQLW